MNQSNNTITLSQPIKRGETKIIVIELRRPVAGELRGLNLTDLLQMDVTALTRVLPRISTPTLTEVEVMALDPADLLQLGATVAGFLLPKAVQQVASLAG
jgi:Phage tail assembly chaperone proteins, E, or 41 or 14